MTIAPYLCGNQQPHCCGREPMLRVWMQHPPQIGNLIEYECWVCGTSSGPCVSALEAAAAWRALWEPT